MKRTIIMVIAAIIGLTAVSPPALADSSKLSADLQSRIAAGEQQVRVIVSHDPALGGRDIDALTRGAGGNSRLHRMNGHAGLVGTLTADEITALAANPGDMSLHYGDIMHAAPPPTGTGPFRECLLTAYTRPDAYNHRGDHSYNDVLLSREDGQVEHLQKVADRT